ncbi:MAG: 4'-phosphopantetheinyl transferase superfamily protein [Gammaproteobacteria bacterium]|nr:4'-phosphopantetheinyl transferase superfamily protein [Gammaproteobacteria bacterium]
MHEKISSAQNILHLWFSRVSPASLEIEHSLQSMLSDSELNRLNSIGGKNRRREYLLSRALMRHALSQTFQRQDRDWSFIELPDAAPVVSNLPKDTHISLSHSQGVICFAISALPLGVDLEATEKQRDFSALAQVFMNREEQARLRDNRSRQTDYFYRVWSAKEACYKRLSALQQSARSLSQLRYSDLVENNSHGYLYQASIEGFVVAAMMADRPQQVSAHFYLMQAQRLRDFNDGEIQA